MTTTTAQYISQLIAKCRRGHVIRGTHSRREGYSANVEGGCWLRCGCGSVGAVKWMTVKIVEEKACNGVCMGATGPSCSCSCGGENHGRAHLA
jgi:hypothetical protein